MEQFFAVATAHFVSLMIPGVDFFLIARTAVSSGRRSASLVCFGIAAANGILIAASFAGMGLVSHPAAVRVIQVGGGLFVAYMGILFLRSSASANLDGIGRGPGSTWLTGLGMGLASGLLNPKNMLFYASLAAVLAHAEPTTLIFYGAWMFGIVLVWDLFVAVVLSSKKVLLRFSRMLPWFTRIAGGILVLFGVGMILIHE